jgi:DNA adenine methylase
MVYMGSKSRIAKHILPIILKDRKPYQYFVDCFAGGMNLIDNVTGPRIANDINPNLIAMFAALQGGWIPPTSILTRY